MLTVYRTDVPSLTLDDWEDIIGGGIFPARTDWEGWDERKQVKVEIDQTEKTMGLPVKEFILDLEHEDEEPFEMMEELADLLDVLDRIKVIARQLRKVNPYDTEVNDYVDAACDAVYTAWDVALCRAAVMIIEAAFKKRMA